MYIVEAKNAYVTAEKEYKNRRDAEKAAAKVANDGYVCLNNPEMNRECRLILIDHVRVYDTRCPDVDIDF